MTQHNDNKKTDCLAVDSASAGSLQYAANCALWLLHQGELSHLFDGDWGDPAEIRDQLEKAGCVPSCDPLKAENVKD